MTKEELDAMVAAEEKRLGVGSKEFMQRHNEIMELIGESGGKGVAADGMCRCNENVDYYV